MIPILYLVLTNIIIEVIINGSIGISAGGLDSLAY